MNPSQHGLIVWLTGLSGAGKTTICENVREMLSARGFWVEVLDGDRMRLHLCRDLGFSKEDRNENILRLGVVADLLARSGAIVLVAAISPYREARDNVRQKAAHFLEVYVNAPLSVCETRDVKGLYRKAREGRLQALTGVDDPYEPPARPEVECQTAQETVADSAAKVLKAILENLAERASAAQTGISVAAKVR